MNEEAVLGFVVVVVVGMMRILTEGDRLMQGLNGVGDGQTQMG